MKQYFYYECIRKAIIQFLDLFNDIKVAKYNDDGSIDKLVEVPLKFLPKQKFYYWLFENVNEKRFPSLGAEITGINHAVQRSSGRFEKIAIKSEEGNILYHLTPTPYDLDFAIHAGSLYVSEMDQIAEQILPYFNPHVVIKITIPEIDYTFNVKVKFEGMSVSNPIEMNEEIPRTIVWDFNFTVEGFILKPVGEAKEVKDIINNFYPFNSLSDDNLEEGEELEKLLLSGKEKTNELIKYEQQSFEGGSVFEKSYNIQKKNKDPYEVNGYKEGTIWINTITGRTFILLNDRWALFPLGTEQGQTNLPMSVYFSRKSGV